jgi:hypothetical protein
MTCDLKMSLAVAAETKLRPLADLVRRLVKQLDTLRQREISETEALVKAEEDVLRWKGLASDYLSDGPGAFNKFQTGLKRAIAREATLKETLVLFKRDLIPHAVQELVESREKLAQAFTTMCADTRADCEAEMARLLAGIVAEHDNWLMAISELGKNFGTAYRGKPPVIYSSRLDEVRHTLTGRRWLTFLHAPAVAVPAVPAAPAPAATGLAAAVPAQPARVESTRTPEVGESATGGGPLPPEAAVVPPGGAAERPGAAACRARVLRHTPATETPEAAPADLDPYPPAPDTLPPDLDAADDQGDTLDGPDAPDAEAPGPSPTPAE